MTALPDHDARVRAMTDHGSTLLVEAGAGSGKTALMAGRVACMLASGTPPRAIAAITFSELAAAELFSRICTYLDRLLAGEVPGEIESVFPDGPSAAQLDHLATARGAIGELTATTIHGFCQQLIRPYPVEANQDPGARVMDEGEATLVWEDLLQEFLRRALDVEQVDNPVAAYVVAEGSTAERKLREHADFVRRHRTARPPAAVFDGSLVGKLVDAVSAFRAWLDGQDYEEETSTELADELNALARAYEEQLAAGEGDLLSLLMLATQPLTCSAHTQKLGWRAWGRKGRWQGAAAAAGSSKAEGGRVSDQGDARYVAVGDAWMALNEMLGDYAFAVVAGQFEELLDDYAAYKREAALLDFDDLLLQARDLLRRNPQIRHALAQRYEAVHVDEFQDTDPVQAEILWLLCGEGEDGWSWSQRQLRPGALFCVGDPKQAIYRFRGADVDTYVKAREAIRAQHPDNVLAITANFRTLAPVLDWVNTCFDAPLSTEGQPGFSLLAAVRFPDHEAPRVAALDVAVPEDDISQERLRESEAAAVAALCTRLIGSYELASRPDDPQVRPGDIALLAPAGTELWRYERALERAGIPVASQAGKGFFRRQEIQDLIAITRAISDSRDTVALGALLRGPLVGLTEEELLDIVAALPPRDDPDALPKLTLYTDPDAVQHEMAREVLRVLQGLARRARATTPFELLAEAVEELRVRPLLVSRQPRGAERALANVDLFLELARPYSVRGLRAFAAAMRVRWEDAESQVEGRPDAEEQAVQLITMHSAKGLEWPVVIPVNTMTGPRKPSGILHDRRDDTLRYSLGAVAGRAYAPLKDSETAQAERECVRLLYVACTRAEDLLVLPRLSAGKAAWMQLCDLRLADLPALELDEYDPTMPAPAPEPANSQDREGFIAEAATIVAATGTIEWRQPSRHERTDDEVAVEREEDAAFVDALDSAPTVRGGPVRGTLLHKLIEEVLTGEVGADAEALEFRAAELMQQLGLESSSDVANGTSSQELAETVLRTIALPTVAGMWSRLQPETAVRSALAGNGATAEIVVTGVADAVALNEDGGIDAVIDWKSDVAPATSQRERYRGQVREYLQAIGATRGLVVYMTLGQLDEVRID